MTTPDRRVADHATGQFGAFTSHQASASGLPGTVLRSRVQSGSLHKIGVRTFRSSTQPPSMVSDLAALVLDIGEPVWATDETAAALCGLEGFVLKPPFHLVTLRDRNVKRAGHVLHTTTRLELIDTTTRHGIPCLSPARALIEVARHIDTERLTTALDSGIRDGLFTEEFLHKRLAAIRTKGRSGPQPVLDAIAGADATRGGHSWLERHFLKLLSQAGLPLPRMQVVLSKTGDKVIRVDGHYPRSPVVVELLGYRWHRSAVQMDNDARRMNKLVLAGFVPIQFTYQRIVEDDRGVISEMRSVLERFL